MTSTYNSCVVLYYVVLQMAFFNTERRPSLSLSYFFSAISAVPSTASYQMVGHRNKKRKPMRGGCCYLLFADKEADLEASIALLNLTSPSARSHSRSCSSSKVISERTTTWMTRKCLKILNEFQLLLFKMMTLERYIDFSYVPPVTFSHTAPS